MKFLRKVIGFLLTVLLGFWLASANILTGTQVGDAMETIVSYLPDRQDIHNLGTPQIYNETLETDSATITQDSPWQSRRASIVEDSGIDFDLIETRIIELVNELRQEQGVSPVESNEMLRAAATIRAQETEESFSHTRPDGSDAFTVFEEEGIAYPYLTVGENLGMATYHLDEEGMAEFIFDGWVESEGHYENMIRPEYEEIGVGVHYDGKYLYATQMFGTQR